MKVIVPLIILIALAGAGYYLFSINPAAPAMAPETAKVSPEPSVMEIEETPVENAMMAPRQFTIDAQNYSFTPKEITVKKGDKVEFVVNNTGGTHDLVIDEFNVKTPMIASGESANVTFTADKVGEFAYYCSVGNHRAMGMEGKLIVTE